MEKGLTPKQEKFCVAYAKCGNLRQAYIEAGYSHSKDSTVDVNACRLLKKDKIQDRLKELQEDYKNSAIADIQEMQEILTSIIRQEQEEEVIVTEGTGQGTSMAVKLNKKPSVNDIVKAINTLGKMQGAFVDKIEADIDTEVNIRIDYGDK